MTLGSSKRAGAAEIKFKVNYVVMNFMQIQNTVNYTAYRTQNLYAKQ